MSDAFKLMFREYDIRGRVNDDEMNEKNVERIARGFASYLKKRNITEVVVGHDNRSYSPGFAEAAIATLVSYGCKVYDIGLALSPVTYFAQYHLNCKGALMITASHNPNGWAGFKLGHDFSKTLGPAEVKELYEIVVTEEPVQSREGSRERINVRDAYINKIASSVKVGQKEMPRVVIDSGNGGAGVFAYELFHKLGCVTFQLNCDPDPSFPHYDPNPSLLTARQRLKEMVTHPYIKADIGIGFDGDGDRIGIIDKYGNNIWSDKILIILAKQLLEKKKNAQIVFDVKCTQALPEVIKENGGIPVMWKTGHSHIKSKLHELNADLAGERSGHIFVGGDDYYGYDDALFAAAKVVEYMAQTGKPIDEIVAEFPQYVTSPEIKAHCADNVKYEIVDKLVAEFQAEYGDKVNTINGARVTFDNGWGLVRASSNLPELVIIFEGKTEQDMREIRSIFREKLDKYDEIDKKWDNDIE